MYKTTTLVMAGSMMVLGALGCVVKNDREKGDAVTAAQALTKAVSFDGGKLVTGLMPETTAKSVTLLAFSGGTIDPGTASIMSFDVDPGDSDVSAALVQFGDEANHFLIDDAAFTDAADGGKPGKLHIELSFETAGDVCEKLCDTVYDVKLTKSVKLRSGKISKHAGGLLQLDCTSKGDHDRCTGKEPDPSTGAGKNDAGGDPSSSRGDASTMLSPSRDGGVKLPTLMPAGTDVCGDAATQCSGMAEYQACVLEACDANYKQCLGDNYASGDYTGSPCESYGNCYSSAADPCTADCPLAGECQACFNTFATCAQSCFSLLDCGNLGDGGAGLPDGSVLPDLTKTCADLDACCFTLDATNKESCQMTAAQLRLIGGDLSCSTAITSFCP